MDDGEGGDEEGEVEGKRKGSDEMDEEEGGKREIATYEDDDDDGKDDEECNDNADDDDDDDDEDDEDPDTSISDIASNTDIVELKLELPADAPKVLMLELVEACCRQTIVREIPGIVRCFPDSNDDSDNDSDSNTGSKSAKPCSLTTEGVNIRGVWEAAFDVLDVHRVYTNDIHALLDTLGVEAARCALTREIAGVFRVYGISVDARHLSLIADYMTFTGGYRPFNRMGMEAQPSVFAKASFETTYSVVKAAAAGADCDRLESPSARLVMGQLVGVGTGCFDLFQGHPE